MKRVVSIYTAGNGWWNAALVKDHGLIVHLLAKEHDCECTMLGMNEGDSFTNAKYIPDVKLEPLENFGAESLKEYMRCHAKEIDILVVSSVYINSVLTACAYKRYNPKGKLYLPLDMNSGWMKTIDWSDQGINRLFKIADVIGSSCLKLVDELSIKAKKQVDYIPNCFFNYTDLSIEYDYEKKENYIITVGRIGALQKGHETLLNAFGIASASIAESWRLVLVGGVDETFNSYVDAFFAAYPHLRDRVLFTGAIHDRVALYDWYKKAKMFVLTSRWEGGTPNVVAEALNFGCTIAVTDFDAALEAINFGKCGMHCEIDNEEAFAEILVKMTSDELALRRMSENALAYGRDCFNASMRVSYLYDRLCGENTIENVDFTQNISACIICRNQPQKVQLTVKMLSLYGFEIVLLDLGSSPGSFEDIYGLVDVTGVYDDAMNLSGARNFAASLASNDYILMMDGEDWLTGLDEAELEEFFTEYSDKTIGNISIRVRSTSGNENEFLDEVSPRVYDRRFFKYSGRMGNTLVSCDDSGDTYTADLAIKVMSAAYDKSGEWTFDKLGDDLKRISYDLQENGLNSDNVYALSKVYYLNGEYEKANEMLKRLESL